ncbi:hypothetical protein F2Q69_00009033 [Brassica cretica]|uniref:Uncharacterized protein n=1 Tax=Brassica cretica TaxID=69181 RepID=A0A8S9P5B6_BRACR|nr:hypothetical protein F2Q69_00009033 [Brassica cretica]
MTVSRNVSSELPRIGPSENPSVYSEEISDELVVLGVSSEICFLGIPSEISEEKKISEELFPRTYFVGADGTTVYNPTSSKPPPLQQYQQNSAGGLNMNMPVTEVSVRRRKEVNQGNTDWKPAKLHWVLFLDLSPLANLVETVVAPAEGESHLFSRQRPAQLDTQPVRDLIPFATQLDTKLDSQHVRDPSQRQSVRDRQQPVPDSTISARDLSNDQFHPATISNNPFAALLYSVVHSTRLEFKSVPALDRDRLSSTHSLFATHLSVNTFATDSNPFATRRSQLAISATISSSSRPDQFQPVTISKQSVRGSSLLGGPFNPT